MLLIVWFMRVFVLRSVLVCFVEDLLCVVGVVELLLTFMFVET